VASHEGRVLVMTTNRPEKLDEALIRPGRVDHQVAFGNATQTQIKELFERMYTNDLPRTKLIIHSHVSKKENDLPTPPPTPAKVMSNGIANGSAKPDGSVIVINGSVKEKVVNEELAGEELSEIARDFAMCVPGDMFSPAEIQGFLLKRKKDPRKALVEVGAWVDGMLEQKRKGTKLISVQ
jgi:chaperone BCS1